MKKYLFILLALAILTLFATQVDAQALRYFTSAQLAPDPQNGDCLTTNGATSTWGNCGTGGSGTPGGGNGQLQYNDNGSFAGTSSPSVTAINATNTAATSTFAGRVQIGSTNTYNNKLRLIGASDDYPTFEIQSGTNIFRTLVNGIGDDLAGLGTFSPDDLILFSSSTGQVRIEAGGDVNMVSNSLNFTNGGDGDSAFKFSQTEDGFMSLQRSGGVDTNHSIFMLQAPEANPSESTFTTMRNYGSNNLEYTDWFNQRYDGIEAMSGIVVAKKGTGELIPFTLRFYNADLGNITANASYGFTVLPTGQMGIAAATTTVRNSGAAFLVASTTLPTMLKGGLEVDGTTRLATSLSGLLTSTAGVISNISTSSLGLAPINSPTFTGTPVLPSPFTIAANSFTRTGAHNLTLTTSATTNVTLPSGTVTLYGTGSGSITSANLATSLSNETGTGNVVFSAAPTFTATSTFAGIFTSSLVGTNIFSPGRFYDSATSTGTLGMVLTSTGTSTRWVATSSLGITGGGGSSNWTDNGTYLSPLTASDGLRVTGSSTFDALQIVNATTSGSLWVGNNRLTQHAAGFFDLQRTGSDYTLMRVRAPRGSSKEATIALVNDMSTTDAGVDEEFVDFYNENYGDSRQWGLRQAYSGTGRAKPFIIGHWDTVGLKDAGNKLIILPEGTVAVARATSTVPVTTAFYVASSTAPNLVRFDSAPGTARFVVESDGDTGIGSSTPAARLGVVGQSGAAVVRFVSDTGTRFMEILNSGVTTLLGTWDFSNATVKQKTYKSFTWPGTATTTSATTTLPLGSAGTAEQWNWSSCKATSGTVNYAFKDDAGNLMNAQTASSTYGVLNLSTNNSFTYGEGRNVDMGPMTNAQLTCTIELIQNN